MKNLFTNLAGKFESKNTKALKAELAETKSQLDKQVEKTNKVARTGILSIITLGVMGVAFSIEDAIEKKYLEASIRRRDNAIKAANSKNEKAAEDFRNETIEKLDQQKADGIVDESTYNKLKEDTEAVKPELIVPEVDPKKVFDIINDAMAEIKTQASEKKEAKRAKKAEKKNGKRVNKKNKDNKKANIFSKFINKISKKSKKANTESTETPATAEQPTADTSAETPATETRPEVTVEQPTAEPVVVNA